MGKILFLRDRTGKGLFLRGRKGNRLFLRGCGLDGELDMTKKTKGKKRCWQEG